MFSRLFAPTSLGVSPRVCHGGRNFLSMFWGKSGVPSEQRESIREVVRALYLKMVGEELRSPANISFHKR